MLKHLYSTLPAAFRVDVERIITGILIALYAMMPSTLAQLFTSIADRLLHDPPSLPATERIKPDSYDSRAMQIGSHEVQGNRVKTPEQSKTKLNMTNINDTAMTLFQSPTETAQLNSSPLQANNREDYVNPSTDPLTHHVFERTVSKYRDSGQMSNQGTKCMMTSVATSPMSPRPCVDYAVPDSFAVDATRNLDWCRWPVCMAYYLQQTCPFGEALCPDAHATSDYAGVINEKGLVRVCFDALGVGGRMCLRRPGYCRFFHAPAHIRYQLLEIRHGNRQSNRCLAGPSDDIPRPTVIRPGVTDGLAMRDTNRASKDSQSAELTVTVAAAIAALIARLMVDSRTQDVPQITEDLIQTLCSSADRNMARSFPQASQPSSYESSDRLISDYQKIDNSTSDQLARRFSTD